MAERHTRQRILADYGQMLWRRRWIILAALIVAILLAVLTRPPDPPVLYQATVSLSVQTYNFSSTGESALVVDADPGVPPAEIESARSVEVASETARELGYTDGGADLLSRLTASGSDDSDILQLTLTGEGRRTVKELSAYSKNYVRFRNGEFQARIDRRLDEITARIAEIQPLLSAVSRKLEAEEQGDSLGSPKTRTRYEALNALYTRFVTLRELTKLDSGLAEDQVKLLGAPIAQEIGTLPTQTLRLFAWPAAGLLIGCAAAIALGILRPRITDRVRLEERMLQPVLATVPRVGGRGLVHDPLALPRVSARGREAIRMLQAELQLTNRSGVIVVTSSEPKEGKTTIATNLAAAFAAGGQTTVLVRADSQRGRRFKSPESPRFHGNSNGASRIENLTVEELDLDEIDGRGLVEKVRDVGRAHHVVVVDAPPLSFANSLLLSTHADLVVLVSRSRLSHEDKVAEAIDILIRHDAPLAGLVLNDVRATHLDTSRYRDYFSTSRTNGQVIAKGEFSPSLPSKEPAEPTKKGR